mgnify:CR=1 FL=1
MRPFFGKHLFWTGAVAIAGALLHIAIMFGGPDWYAFFGAPAGLVELARIGHPRAAISCLVIASFLFILAAYAFSGAKMIRRLPLLRPVLAMIGLVLIARGALFIPMILWRPDSLARICDCRSVDTFIVVTSILCLTMGISYAAGAVSLPSQSRND